MAALTLCEGVTDLEIRLSSEEGKEPGDTYRDLLRRASTVYASIKPLVSQAIVYHHRDLVLEFAPDTGQSRTRSQAILQVAELTPNGDVTICQWQRKKVAYQTYPCTIHHDAVFASRKQSFKLHNRVSLIFEEQLHKKEDRVVTKVLLHYVHQPSVELKHIHTVLQTALTKLSTGIHLPNFSEK